jgi:hypothetical protein
VVVFAADVGRQRTRCAIEFKGDGARRNADGDQVIPNSFGAPLRQGIVVGVVALIKEQGGARRIVRGRT